MSSSPLIGDPRVEEYLEPGSRFFECGRDFIGDLALSG
jgi:hypothetical protein